jgi:hypothetical protein
MLTAPSAFEELLPLTWVSDRADTRTHSVTKQFL